MAHDVFVSYSRADKPVADAAVSRLEAHGIRCWIAPRDEPPGHPWGGAIIQAIDTAQVFLLVLSSHSHESEHVAKETIRAVEQRLDLIPFRIEDIQPTGNVAYAITGTHWLDALTPPLEKHLGTLVESIRPLLNRRGATNPGVGQVPPDPVSTTAPSADASTGKAHRQDSWTLQWLERAEDPSGRGRPFLSTTRDVTREEVEHRRFMKIMSSGRSFLCDFGADGTFAETPVFGASEPLTGRWQVRDGWLLTRLSADGIDYETRSVGIEGIRAMRIHESDTSEGSDRAGLFVSLPPPDAELPGFPRAGTLWVKIMAHRALLVEIQESGHVLERDLFGSSKRWSGVVNASGELKVDPWTMSVGPSMGPIPYLGKETGPGRTKPDEVFLAPVPSLPGSIAKDWTAN